MKRVTVLFEDESLYLRLKATAANQGRPVKDVVAEAVSDWIQRHAGRISDIERVQRRAALDGLAAIRAEQQPGSQVDDDLAWHREMYSRAPGERQGGP
jgi:hypothetical protein